MKNISYGVGDILFREGEKSSEVYRILRGRVEISIDGNQKAVTLAQLGEGDIFGEMAMIDERPRSSTARATTPVECEVMSPEDFQHAIFENPRSLIPYLASFFERLRTLNDRLQLETRLRVTEQASSPALQKQHSLRAPHHPERSRFPLQMDTIHIEPPAGARTAIIHPMTPLCASKIDSDGSPVQIEKFPFRIGRQSEHVDKTVNIFSANDFPLLDQEPYQISRSHCSIEREGDSFFVRDRGSKLGTIVNGNPIGIHHSTLTCDLREGVNTVILGSIRSPFKFQVELE
jgi:hypothetical protein